MISLKVAGIVGGSSLIAATTTTGMVLLTNRNKNDKVASNYEENDIRRKGLDPNQRDGLFDPTWNSNMEYNQNLDLVWEYVFFNKDGTKRCSFLENSNSITISENPCPTNWSSNMQKDSGKSGELWVRIKEDEYKKEFPKNLDNRNKTWIQNFISTESNVVSEISSFKGSECSEKNISSSGDWKALYCQNNK